MQVLEGENAVAKNREVMGATDPANAAPGTIRKDFAESIEANSVHGSDSPDNARQRDRVLLFGLGDRRVNCPSRSHRPLTLAAFFVARFAAFSGRSPR